MFGIIAVAISLMGIWMGTQVGFCLIALRGGVGIYRDEILDALVEAKFVRPFIANRFRK